MNNPTACGVVDRKLYPTAVRDWVYLAGAVVAVAFWCFTIYGLPPRVDKLEHKVAAHEERLTRTDVKMDIMLDDVKTIKSILMRFSRER